MTSHCRLKPYSLVVKQLNRQSGDTGSIPIGSSVVFWTQKAWELESLLTYIQAYNMYFLGIYEHIYTQYRIKKWYDESLSTKDTYQW